MLQTMIDNFPEKTGRSLEAWLDEVAKTDLTKHGAIRTHLKEVHGMGHGFANLVAHTFCNADGEEDPLAVQYAKKPTLRPFYDALLAGMAHLDFEIVPKKTATVWKRDKTFAYLQPSTKTRLDVGIALPDHAGTERLVAKKGMTSHKVGVTQASDIDAELLAWLTEAWERS